MSGFGYLNNTYTPDGNFLTRSVETGEVVHTTPAPVAAAAEAPIAAAPVEAAAAAGGGAASWIGGHAMPLMAGIEILGSVGNAFIQYWYAEAQNAFKEHVADISADVQKSNNASQVKFGKMLQEANKEINTNRHDSAVGVAKTRGDNAVTLTKAEEKRLTKSAANHRPVYPNGSPAVAA